MQITLLLCSLIPTMWIRRRQANQQRILTRTNTRSVILRDVHVRGITPASVAHANWSPTSLGQLGKADGDLPVYQHGWTVNIRSLDLLRHMDPSSTINGSSVTATSTAVTSRSAEDGRSLSSKKLKDSCTECAASKVKCTREYFQLLKAHMSDVSDELGSGEKPACQRCVRRNRPCVYAASRRSGRSSVRIFAFDDSNRPSRGGEGPNSNDDESFAWQPESCFNAVNNLHQDLSVAPWDEQTFSEFVSATMPTWPAPPPQPDGSSDYASVSSRLSSVSGGLESQPSPGIDLSLPDYPCWPLEHPVDESNELLYSSLTPTAPVAPVAPMLPQSAEQPTTNEIDTADHKPEPSNCLAKAMTLLLSLSRQKPFAVTLDTVLQRNREVIGEMTKILSCDCSRDGYLASILGLVLLKLLAWYSAAASGADQTPCSTSAFGSISWTSFTDSTSTSGASTSFSSPSISSQNLAGYPRKLSQPGYSCGWESGEAVLQQDSQSAAEGRKSAQVVMAELHQAQRLMKLLTTRAEERRSQQDSMNIDQMSEEEQAPTGSYDSRDDDNVDTSQLSESMLSHMEVEIGKRFRVVCAATIQRLRIM